MELSLQFMITATPNAWTDTIRQQIFDWLFSPREYCDFISSDNLDKVYKIIFTSPLEFNTINLTEGYFSLTAQSYPYAYTALTTYTQSVTSTPITITINNLQNARNYDNTYYYYPIIYADLTGAASSIKIVNTSDSNRVFEITGLDALEELYIDNELKIINSSVASVNRFATLTSKQWLRLVKGENILRIDTLCDLVIQCQYPILS
jgi:phage-related protein